MSERIYSETFKPGTIIVKIGDPGDYAYIVQKGKVEVSVPVSYTHLRAHET